MQVPFKKALAQCFARHYCSHGRRQRVAVAPSWIFIYGTDKVERGLMVLFFRSCFFRCSTWPRKFYCQRPWLQ